MIYTGVSLDQIQIIDCGDLVRVGHGGDGGYVLPECVIERCRTLLSFGISSEWSFEEHFLKLNPNVNALAFDRSVALAKFVRRAAQGLPAAAMYWASGKQRRAQKHWQRVETAVAYFAFFRGRVRHYPFHVGNAMDHKTMSIADVMALVPPADRAPLVVKMDIEGAEYRVLADLLPYADEIDCIAIEFHETDICSAAFDTLIAMLSPKFCIAHVHGNNACGAAGNGFPLFPEITFLNRRLLPPGARPSRRTLPIPGLDFPNDASLPEIDLSFLCRPA